MKLAKPLDCRCFTTPASIYLAIPWSRPHAMPCAASTLRASTRCSWEVSSSKNRKIGTEPDFASASFPKGNRNQAPSLFFGFAEVCRLARRTGQLNNVHPSVGAVDRVNVAAIVHLDIVGLDRHFAGLAGTVTDAAFVGTVADGRDIVTNLFRLVGIAHVNGTHTSIEMRH